MFTPKNIIKFIILVSLIVAFILFAQHYNLYENLKPHNLRETILSYGSTAPIIFIASYIASILFLLPTTPFNIAGGALFGTLLGTVYAVIAGTIGATIGFLLARYLGRGFIFNLLKQKFKKLEQYDNKIEKNGFAVVVLLRLIPIFPFHIVSYGLGFTKVKFLHYFLGTFLGMTPGAFLFTYFGNSIFMINLFHLIISAVLILLLIFSPTIYKKWKKKN